MSYPPPPGSSSSSLPPRPPASRVSGFKPAFAAATPPTHTPSPGTTASPYSAPPTYSSAPSYAGTTASQYGAPPTAYQSYGRQGYQQPGMTSSYQYSQQGYPQNNYYGAQGANSGAGTYAAPPQIRNPFPAPSQTRNDDYDPESAAQYAAWQSAYEPASKDGAAPGAVPGRPDMGGNGATTYSAEANKIAEANAASAALNEDKKKTVVRQGGGQKWTDDTLLEWDPSHLRLFVGNLAGETTDDSLYKAFSQWRSLQKARVIRDKVTSKSKGYGFVSFSDPDEFFSAAKEMNGKYIQSHPVVVRKSTTEIKPQAVKEKNHGNNRWNKNKNKNKNRHNNGNGSGSGREGSHEPNLGAKGGGVYKPGQKTKGGLKLLG
ncbi:hypothetical protein F4778DRAFT_333046 [Xylariomycetidae sp. FL2044]|nr:hypothetical protein F4778DRAFT_333046 [Xylariomycetidae sp. FL2044]